MDKLIKYFQIKLNNRIFHYPPVMIVGMHRSGTGLLAKILEILGVFMGNNLSANHESLFFQKINKEVLDMNGSNWRHIDDLEGTQDFLLNNRWMMDYTRKILESKIAQEHFGVSLKNMFFYRVPKYWGWKDPRNSVLIPLWKEVFPKITVLHILRDGRDVALSLVNRDRKRRKIKDNNVQLYYDRFKSYFDLWEKYLTRIYSGLELVEKKYQLKYENLLENPKDEIRRIGDFMGLSYKDNIDAASSIVDSGKILKSRFDRNPLLKTVKLSMNRLENLGYR